MASKAATCNKSPNHAKKQKQKPKKQRKRHAKYQTKPGIYFFFLLRTKQQRKRVLLAYKAIIIKINNKKTKNGN